MYPHLTDALMPVLGVLRAQYFLYQTAHWQTSGRSFYGNHLFFQRLYESVAEDLDAMAEKMVGLGGVESVEPLSVLALMSKCVQEGVEMYSCPFERSLYTERELQGRIKKAYEGLKTLGELTLGLDDYLMSLASKHETNMYLVQQVFEDHPVDIFANWTFCEGTQ